MSICPNKNLPEWKSLEAAVGSFEAFKDFMETNGEIRSVETVQAKIAQRGNGVVYQLNRTGDSGEPVAVEVLTKMLDTLAAKFDGEYGYKIVYDTTSDWKGKVVPGSQENGGKPTIVINGSKATLDTPLHEFGHIFLNYIKAGNIELYSKLMDEWFSPRFGDRKKNAAGEFYKDETGDWVREKLPIKGQEIYDEVVSLYGDKGLSQIELKEEALVEMLGRYAAGHIDKSTGLYQDIKNFWEMIKKAIREVLGLTSGDVLTISPTTPIEDLANLLAHNEWKISIGGSEKEHYERSLKYAREDVVTAKENFSKLKGVLADESTKVLHVNNYTMIVTEDSLRKINRLKNALPDIRKYFSGNFMSYQDITNANENFLKDTDLIFKQLTIAAAQERDKAEVTTLDQVSDNVLKRFEESPAYSRWKYFVKDPSIQRDIKRFIKEVVRREPASQEAIRREAKRDFIRRMNTVVNSIRETTTDDFLESLLRTNPRALRHVFGESYKPLYTDYVPVATKEQLLRHTEKRIATVEERLEKKKKGVTSGTRRFTLEFTDPKSGKTETDTFTVTTRPDPDGIDVTFSSSNWRFDDPYWANPLDNDTRIKPGKTEFRLSNEFESRGFIQEVRDGYARLKFERRAPTRIVEGEYGMSREKIYPEDEEGYALVPIENVLVVTSQNRASVMPKVIEAIAAIHYNTNYNAITFNAAPGSSIKRKDKELRQKMYDRWARRTFGANYAGTHHSDYKSVISIPRNFRTGFNIDRELYQVEREASSEIPFGSEAENTLPGQAILNAPVQAALDPASIDKVQAIELANKMSSTLGIDYQLISAKDAEVLTKDAKNPWNGENAFFIGGRVYFVGDNLSMNQVFHEFSHPFVRAIAVDNAELFNKLYEDLAKTDEGQFLIDEVKALYPELDQESDLFKEEVIVKALTKAGTDQLNGLESPKGFRGAIKEILFAIKRFLRKAFGKSANVSKLDSSTSLTDLADMLNKGGVIKLDTSKISQEDVAAYVREQEQYIEDLTKVEQKQVQTMINRVYDISSKHIDTLLRRKEYDELAVILTDEHNRGDLQEMKSRLQEYKGVVTKMAQDTKTDMEDTRKRVTALVDTMFRLETVMEKVLLHMQDIAKSEDSIENMHKAYYYDYLVKYWENFVKEANKAFDESDLPVKSPVTQLLTDVSTSIRKINAITDKLYANGARDTLYNELAPMGESIKGRYDKVIADMKAKNAPQSRIDKVYKEYYGVSEADYNALQELEGMLKAGTPLAMAQQNKLERLRREAAQGIAISPQKIEMILKGQMGDANFFNSYLEGYLYNTDPVIGGLALYVKNKMNDVMALSQAKYNDFATDMKPLLEKAGINFHKIGDLGQKVGFVDTVSKRDEDGNLVEREVWSFLNEFKGYRFKHDQLKDAVDKAQTAAATTGTEEDHQALKDAIAERQTFMRDYFHQEYVPEFYDRQKLFEKDEAGKEAGYLRKNLFERMRMLSEPATTESDFMEIADELDELWREYRQLHSTYNTDGTKKTGMALDVANRLTDYREASRDFYEWKQRKGIFENSLAAYEQELADEGITDAEEFKVLKDEWIRRNTRTVIKDSFYEYRADLIEKISEIMAKLPDTERKQLDQSAVWEDIHDLTAGYKDDDGQPNASEMSKNSIAQVKANQEKLEKLRENYMQRNGLTKAENQRLNELHTLKGQGNFTPSDASEMSALYNKKNAFGLNKWDMALLDSYYAELGALSKREATEYYTDILNGMLESMNTDKLFLEIGARSFTRVGADYLLENPALLNDLLSQSQEFKDWFTENHIEKEVFDKATGTKIKKWERLHVWSVVRPMDEAHMETYEIKDATGKVTDTIKGLPSMKYYSRVVKPEFKTERVIGETVDNKGSWLPKTMEQGAKDDRFINKDYAALKEKDPALFDVLEKLKEHHLKNQDGLSYKSRLYLDYPRFRKEILEVLQTKGVAGVSGEKMNALTIWAQRVKEFFTGAKDQAQDGLNDKEEFNLVRADMFDNEVTSVPIAGLYDTDIADVSTDITTIMMRYMLSGERQKQLVKISPTARAVQAVVNNPENGVKDTDRLNKFNFENLGIKTYLNKKGHGIRQKAVNNFIEREFEGQRMTGATKDVPWLNNTASLLFKRASFGFFALNIPSALKNSYGAKFQGMIEASAGKHMNHISFQKGNGWSYATMGELSFGNQLYTKGPKSLRQQIVEIFDPSQGRFEEKFGEGMSRTITKDTASMSWLYNFRKWVELQATLQIFGGMMYHKKVKQGDTEIAYMNAWELRDGKIQLKEGVDPKWGITYDENGEMKVGKEFSKFKNTVHQAMNDMQGAYAQFDQPEAQRYLVFRFLSYLRRYFTTMTLNRWGFSGRWFNPQPRLNPGAGDVQLGFYVEFLRTLKNTVTQLGRNLPYMTKEEKSAALKVLTEVGGLYVTVAMMSMLFGWDPDDDEKYAKLRERSGALPFPLTSEDTEREYNTWGFLENHALFLLMNVRAENEQFIPLPGYGLDDYTAMLDLKSIAFGPTVQTYKQLLEDALYIVQDDERAYYKRRVGPYEWQDEGGSKFMTHLARTIGMTGSSLDPAKAIKGFQSVQARAR